MAVALDAAMMREGLQATIITACLEQLRRVNGPAHHAADLRGTAHIS